LYAGLQGQTITKASIADLQGREILNFSDPGPRLSISGLPGGLYFFSCSDATGREYRQKFIHPEGR
jgi:hypothetical protein